MGIMSEREAELQKRVDNDKVLLSQAEESNRCH